MIKVIAFDFIGVLVNKNKLDLSLEEKELSSMFDSIFNDADYLIAARKILNKDSTIISVTENLIEKLYKTKDSNIFKKIKEIYPDIKIIISTNHLSFIRNYIGEYFDINYLDDLIISAEVHKVKPNINFYNYLLDKYNINSNELLLIDYNKENISITKKMGIPNLLVNEESDIINEIVMFINNY